jgi:hypothetical protein
MRNSGEFQETASIGYRYQPEFGGLVFRTVIDPLILIGKSFDGEPVRLLGASIGYAF